MTDVDVEWDGDSPEDMARELAKLESIVMDYLEEAMETAVLLIESTAKQLVPVDTGRLRSSIASEVEKVASNVLVGYIGSNVKYAPFVELGTEAHIITGDPLAWEEGGETHFATTVHHPGTEPQPFLAPAVETHIDDIEDLLKQAVDDAVDEIS